MGFPGLREYSLNIQATYRNSFMEQACKSKKMAEYSNLFSLLAQLSFGHVFLSQTLFRTTTPSESFRITLKHVNARVYGRILI